MSQLIYFAVKITSCRTLYEAEVERTGEMQGLKTMLNFSGRSFPGK